MLILRLFIDRAKGNCSEYFRGVLNRNCVISLINLFISMYFARILDMYFLVLSDVINKNFYDEEFLPGISISRIAV